MSETTTRPRVAVMSPRRVAAMSPPRGVGALAVAVPERHPDLIADADRDGSVATMSPTGPASSRPQVRSIERGSQTMEYALLLIVAATIAMLALTWARQGAIKSLLDAVMAKVLALFGIGG